jgi:hypothetical protein
MGYIQIIRHIETTLNQCGDLIVFEPTGDQVMSSEYMQMSIEIKNVLIKRENNCGTVARPSPMSNNNPPDKYWVNRIRISPSLAEDYTNGFPLKDDEIRSLISDKTFLFGYY